VDYQYVKLVDGTPDSTAKIQGTEANGLEVDVTRLPSLAAGTAFAGKVQLTDGTSDATVRNLAANDALNVAIVDGAGNQVTTFAGSGGSSATDNSAFTAGTTADTTVAGFYQSTPTAVTDGRSAAIGIDENRRVKVSVDASTLDLAHGVADSGNPVKVGHRVQTALPTAEVNNDRTNSIADEYGRQLISHISPGMQVWKSFNATTTQTGVVVWDPAAGKKIAITSIEIGTYGTTAARVILFFNTTTTYTEGTHQPVFKASFAPSATVKPGAVQSFSPVIYSATADAELRITTDAGISIDVVVYGYEFS